MRTKAINELAHILMIHLGWNKARIDCLTRIIIGLFTVKTVNLVELSQAFISKAKPQSSYKRIQRFLRSFTFDVDMVAALIVRLFFSRIGGYYLSLDATHWDVGKKTVKILMLAMIYNGVAIPLYWKILNKRGATNNEERLELLQKFIKNFGKKRIAGLIADGEFASNEIFAFLKKHRIHFFIRGHLDTLITTPDKKITHIHDYFYHSKIGREIAPRGRFIALGQKVGIAAMRLNRRDILVVLTSSSQDEALRVYRYRSQIETLFSALKMKGFCFEDTHISEVSRINKLLAIVVIAFCWAHYTGEWLHHKIKKINIKNNGNKLYSFFRYGFDYIRQHLLNAQSLVTGLLRVIKRFGCVLENPRNHDIPNKLFFSSS